MLCCRLSSSWHFKRRVHSVDRRSMHKNLPGTICNLHLLCCTVTFYIMDQTAHSVQWPGYGLVNPEFDFQQKQEIFLFSKMSTLALMPNQPSIQWIQGSLGKATRTGIWPITFIWDWGYVWQELYFHSIYTFLVWTQTNLTLCITLWSTGINCLTFFLGFSFTHFSWMVIFLLTSEQYEPWICCVLLINNYSYIKPWDIIKLHM
jgi:hypothetical protein